MGETKCRKELDAVVRMYLDGKRDDPGRRQCARHIRQNRAELVDIDKDVGGEHEIMCFLIGDFAGEKIPEITDREPIVNFFRLGARSSPATDRCQRAARRTGETPRRQARCRSRGPALRQSAVPA